jgi:FkbM family methyltransferase
MSPAKQAIREVSTPASDGRELHRSRHFDAPPDRATARRFMEQINDGDCRLSPRSPRAPLVLYGAGDLGRMARDYLKAIGQDFSLIVDRDAARLRHDPFWAGSQLVAPSEVADEIKRSAMLLVCVATVPFRSIEAYLAGEGWTDIVPFYDLAESQRHHHPLSNGWFADRLSAEEMRQTTDVIDRWDDDVSRAHNLQFFAWRRLREEWTFDGAPVTRDDRFLIPEVVRHLDGVRVFVDGGAHHGSITEKFAMMARGSSVIALEPDDGNIAAFRQMQAGQSPEIAARIELLPYALDARERERRFHEGLGYASQFAETGNRIVRTKTLDSLDIAPDFVKLHLEGAELDALRGGIEMIRRHRPILAVTTYHNADGVWRTPAWLMDNLDDYRFLMRLHSWCGTGAVVYAIPRERKAAP